MFVTRGYAEPLSPPARPGIGPDDTRRAVTMKSLPWNAIGRVQTELGGRCTGFLVAPAVVETAAHCLWLVKTRRYIQPHDIHFLRAYDRGQYAAHARVTRFLVSPGYDPEHEATTASFDRATLFLENPAGTAADILPVAPGLPSIGDGVTLGGYEQDYREILTSDMRCHVVGIFRNGEGYPMIGHDCDATRGSSGAPLLGQQNGRWVALGVQVLANSGQGGSAAPLSFMQVSVTGK
ncbi:trypsin-like serine peptidase [Acetobacter oeni]|nr:trypsin-like serine protease [Acetobacter oeni]MBB3884699.1 protease YdgD [Acetobacter oeni]